MNSNRRSTLVLVLIWLGLIILSAATGHFNVPERLSTSWNHFLALSLGEQLLGLGLFLLLAIPVSLVAFTIGLILLPLEIVVFPILALVTLNGFWLTMFLVWKYALLFTFVF